MQACPPRRERNGKAQVTCRAPCVRLLDASQVGAPLEGRYKLRGSGPAALDCTQERPCALGGASHYGDHHLRFMPVSWLISCLDYRIISSYFYFGNLEYLHSEMHWNVPQ